MKASEAIDAAVALLSEPGKWTTDAFAKTKSGKPTSPLSKAAVCFCAAGAVRHVQRTNRYTAAQDYLERVIPTPFSDFNDSRKTVGPVLRLMRKAAALARKEGQ